MSASRSQERTRGLLPDDVLDRMAVDDAERRWKERIAEPWDDTFHSIFVPDQRIQREGIQLDLCFRDVVEWSSASFEWPEFDHAGLAEGWIAFDRCRDDKIP